MSFLIFIPARSGSLRLKNKNIKLIKKKTLFEYTLNFAKKLNLKNIFISTDSNKIKKICLKNKFKFSYIRPKSLSKNKTSMIETVIHGLNWYKKNVDNNIKDIILLQPTFPMRNLYMIKKAINFYKKKKLCSMTSISRLKLDSSCLLHSSNQKKYFQFQKNLSLFKIDGNFYISSIKFLNKYKKFTILNKTYFINSHVRFPIDIDYKEDFLITKCLIENVKKR